MKTKIFIEEFKGQKLFAMFEVDDAGNKVKEWPEVSFGARKASELLTHMTELEAFVKANPYTPKKPR